MQRKAIIPSIPTAWWVTAIIFFLIAFMSIDRAPKRLPVQASKQPDTKQSTLMQAWSTRWATNTTAKRVERKILSLHPRIELEENFLSDDAVAKLLVLHHDDSSGYLNDDGRGVAVRHWVAGDVQKSAALQEFERNVASWTSTPYDDRSGLQCRQQTVVGAHRHANNLHIDTHQAKNRIATVIGYLATMRHTETGFTAFPCLLPSGSEFDHLRKKRKEICRKAAWSGATSYTVGETNGEVDRYGMLELAQGVCDGSIPGLRVHPKKGTAVMFDYSKPDDAELLWHLGCDVVAAAGSTSDNNLGYKYCVQKFKEIPVHKRRAGQGRNSRIYAAVEKKLEAYEDEDGNLGVEELGRLLDGSGEETRKIDPGALLAQSDLDGDGRLDAQEAAFRFETHISSEAFWVQ